MFLKSKCHFIIKFIHVLLRSYQNKYRIYFKNSSNFLRLYLTCDNIRLLLLQSKNLKVIFWLKPI